MHLKMLSTLIFLLFCLSKHLSSFTLLSLFSQVVCNTMALCSPDGKFQMERSMFHKEMIMVVELIF